MRKRYLVGCGCLGVALMPFSLMIMATAIARLAFPLALRMPDPAARSYVHTMIRMGIRGHDTVLFLGGLANKDSIPILISCLPPSPTPDGVVPSDCIYGHSRETLNKLTNCAPGYDQISWNKWWEANRHKTLEQIQKDSYAEIGLPADWEKDEASARGFMRALVHAQEHWRKVAGEALQAFPTEALFRARDACVASSDAEERRGAVEWMAGFERTAGQRPYDAEQPRKTEEILAALSKDPDEEVRARALGRLNSVRTALPTPNEEDVIGRFRLSFSEGLQEAWTEISTSHLLVAGKERERYDYRPEILTCYDIGEQAIDWSYPCGDMVFDASVVQDGRLFVSTLDGVAALDVTTGQECWKAQAPSQWRSIYNKMMLRDGILAVHRGDSVRAFAPADGTLLWTVNLHPESSSETLWHGGFLGYTQGHFFVVTHDFRLLRIATDGKIVAECHLIPEGVDVSSSHFEQLEYKIFGLSAKDGAVYVGVGNNKTPSCQAYSASTLEPLWQRGLSPGSHIQNFLHIGECILCTSERRIWCLAQDDGGILWTEDLEEMGFCLDLFEYDDTLFLAKKPEEGLVVRRLCDGSIVAVYPEYKTHSSFCNAIRTEKEICLAYGDGTVWLLKAPQVAQDNARNAGLSGDN